MPVTNSIKNKRQENWFKALSQAISDTEISSSVSERKLSHEKAFIKFKEFLDQTRNHKGTIWMFGNGGSLATCMHISQDIQNRLHTRTETLSSGPLMTCVSNDIAFNHCFLTPFQQHVQPTDMLIVLSCSGESSNIINTVCHALENQIKVISLSAMKQNNKLRKMNSDLHFWVPTSSFGIAEVAHHAILHNYVETLAEGDDNMNLAEQQEAQMVLSEESFLSLA